MNDKEKHTVQKTKYKSWLLVANTSKQTMTLQTVLLLQITL